MARNFYAVVGAIKMVASDDLVTELEKSAGFWAPEERWERLSSTIQKMVPKSSRDLSSIATYALLCDCSLDEMKSRFEGDNF